ncbi:hypothetical protein ACTFIY_001186 [Dictyostelium cf. discoideum]
MVLIESISNKLDNLNDTHLQNCDENQIYKWLENEEIYQLIKKYQQSSIIVNNKDNISNLNKLKEYDNQSILFNNQIIDDIKNNLKFIYKFNNNNQNNKNNINIIDNNSVSNRIHIYVGRHVDSTDDTLNHTLDNVNNKMTIPPLNYSNSYGLTVDDVIKYHMFGFINYHYKKYWI